MLLFDNVFYKWDAIVQLYPKKWAVIENAKFDTAKRIITGELLAVGERTETDEYMIKCFEKGRIVDHQRTTMIKKGTVVGDRFTWKEIQEKYPNQWVGLAEVKYVDDDGITIESAIVEYTDKSKDEITEMSIRGETVGRYTTPDDIIQVGVLF